MNIYFAPLEGLTDNVYRTLHQKYFPGIRKYYTPFFSPTVHRSLTPREERELSVVGDLRAEVVPQVLTKNPEDFLWFASVAAERGYKDIILNLGCPSGTVFSKGKGSGMLRDLDGLDRFLCEIFRTSPLPISVKTRLGIHSAEEFPQLLTILNQYPIYELILHPRVQEQFYKGAPDMDSFSLCAAESKAPVCYNGNLSSLKDIEKIQEAYTSCESYMVGRALIADPGMFSPGGTDRQTLSEFMEALTEEYIRTFGSEKNAMFRLKENWFYLLSKFERSEKLGKSLRKTTNLSEFKTITREILTNLPMRETISPHW